MDGRTLHRWARPFEGIFPGAPPLVPEESGRRWLDWRRARLLPDGGLLGIHEGFGLFTLDHGSEVRWALPNRAHHDVAVLPDGRMWVLERHLQPHPSLRPAPVLEDFLVELDAEGRELRRLSILTALERGAPSLAASLPTGPDVLHTNSVRVLDGTGADRTPWLAAGGLLVSLRELDVVAAIDPDAGRVVGWLHGPWDAQHDASITPEGHVLVFDNHGNGGHARGLEVDPATGAVVWAWPPRPDDTFRSPVCGTAQRLPNGNTLLVASSSGRAVEVTREGDVVWAYDNPGRRGALVALLLQVDRLPAEAWPAPR